jgi:hypothetical protein
VPPITDAAAVGQVGRKTGDRRLNDEKPASSQQTGRPAKLRTWWHPLLVRLLNHLMARAYEVRDEELVGRMPLRVDILLIRREQGQLSDAAVRDLDVLVPLLNRFTLVEFKGPTDALEPGDLAQLIGCAFLWHSQQTERTRPDEMTLVIVAPRLNESLQDDLRLFGWRADECEPGVFFIAGAPWTMWMVETDVMAERGQPVLSLVSRPFLKRPRDIMKRLKDAGQVPLICYALQQVHQFCTLGEEFAMQHADTECLEEVDGDLRTALLELFQPENPVFTLDDLRGVYPLEELLRGLPPEDRLRGLPPEDRLRGLPPEDRLRGLSAEDVVKGLSEPELARVRKMLERDPDA